jgi:hypothetical protein
MDTSMILTFHLLHQQQQNEKQRRKATLLRIRSSLRVRNAISSVSLPADQESSAWYIIYKSRDEGTFINVVSIPPADFDDLLYHFNRHYIVKSGPGKRGRPPRVVAKHSVLALLMHFYTHATEHKTLCELFAVAPSTFSRVLKNAEEALGKALMDIPDAAVKWPSIPLQRHWAKKTNEREPLVEGVFAFVDGKNFRVQQPSDVDLQNAMYNGTGFVRV